jgi:hypothetical protein
MILSALRCSCGSAEVMAVAPGTEPDGDLGETINEPS